MKYYPYAVDSKGNIQYLSPRDFLLDILRSLYGLDKVESREIVDTAIKILIWNRTVAYQ